MKRILIATMLTGVAVSAVFGTNGMKMTIYGAGNVKLLTENIENVDALRFTESSSALPSKTKMVKPGFTVMPSAKNKLSLNLTGGAVTPYSITIYDLKGREMYAQQGILTKAGVSSLTLPQMASGAFLVKAIISGQQFTQRINFLR